MINAKEFKYRILDDELALASHNPEILQAIITALDKQIGYLQHQIEIEKNDLIRKVELGRGASASRGRKRIFELRLQQVLETEAKLDKEALTLQREIQYFDREIFELNYFLLKGDKAPAAVKQATDRLNLVLDRQREAMKRPQLKGGN